MAVSGKCGVYSSSKNFWSSLVLNTGSSDCSLKCLSLDHIGRLSSNANAKNGTSFSSEISCDAFSLKTGAGSLNSINLDNSETFSKKVSLETFDLEQISLEYFCNSSIRYFGENNLSLCSFNNLFVNESFLNKENRTLVSATNCIYNLLSLDDLSMLSFNLFPNSMQSSSVSLEFAKSFWNFSNTSSCFILLANASLAIEDQLSHSNLSILCLNSSGTDNVSDGMFMSYTCNTCDMYDNIYHVFKDFGLEQVMEMYDKFNSAPFGVSLGVWGEEVLLTVEGTDCDGEGIDLFVIWEDDFFGEPEYYFVSSLGSDSTVRIDSRDYCSLLRVVEAGGFVGEGCPDYVWTGVR